MKITNKIASVFAAIFGVFALASCNSNDTNEYKITQTFPSCVTTSSIGGSSVVKISQGMSFTLNINYTAGTVDVTMQSFKDANDQSYAEFTFPGLKLQTTSAGWVVIEANNVQGYNASGAPGPLFSHFVMRIFDRVLNNSLYVPFMETRFSFQGNSYVSTLSNIYYQATTKCTESDGNVFTPDTSSPPTYTFVVNAETMEATIGIDNAAFDHSMSKTYLAATKLPFKVTTPGIYTIDAPATVNAYEGSSATSLAPSKLAKFSNIKATFDGAGNLDLSFDIETENYSGNSITSHVVATCSQPSAAK